MNYLGPERRASDRAVTHGEWQDWCEGLGTRLDAQDTLLRKLNVAMFAEDDVNDFGQSGVMTTMQRLNAHIDMVCIWGLWARKFITFLAWGIGIAGTVAGAWIALKQVAGG